MTAPPPEYPRPEGVGAALVRQLDRYGCAVACCAMVRSVSYPEVAKVFGAAGRGFTHDEWMEYLARYGFAFQFHYQHDCIARRTREPWPLAPWADLHICSVDAGHGIGSHAVVLLRDGTVLDPATDAPRRLSDYPSVAYMAAVHRVDGAAILANPITRTALPVSAGERP